ncbi:MAG TPA: hypothetical protein VJB11_02940 [archaeon]|nr:hypothetical protein [archaeon]
MSYEYILPLSIILKTVGMKRIEEYAEKISDYRTPDEYKKSFRKIYGYEPNQFMTNNDIKTHILANTTDHKF